MDVVSRTTFIGLKAYSSSHTQASRWSITVYHTNEYQQLHNRNNSGPKEGTDERSVEYARRLLNTSNYFTTEHEALAIVWATMKIQKTEPELQ